MQDGQADNGPGTIDDLAQFLMDNPDATGPVAEEDAKPEENPEEPEEDNSEENEEAPADDDSEEEESEEPKKQASGLKFKVPVKGEDGQDASIEVDEKELIAGYQRHADYTRKTQALADKEREVTQQVAEQLEQGRNHYITQAQMARAAVLQLAGLRSPQEMAQLAATDPAAWVQEQQRATAVQAVLYQLEQGMTQEQQKAVQKQQEEMQREVSRAWGVLGQHGFDKPKLADLYDKVSAKYGIPKERLHANTDPTLVLLMRDALELKGLKEKKAEVTKKASDAPKLPPKRQAVPQQEQTNRKLNERFRTGKAKLNDLAAFIAANKL